MVAQLMGNGKVFAGCSKICINKDDLCLLHHHIYTAELLIILISFLEYDPPLFHYSRN